MIKLLLTAEVLLEAARDQGSESYQLIQKCRMDELFQVWTLSTVVQDLLANDVPETTISHLFESIAQIPLNAYLNKSALKSPLGFQMGLYEAAARTFRIDRVVSTHDLEESTGITFLNTGNALTLDVESDTGKVDFNNLNLGLHSIFDQVDGWYMEIIQNTAFASGFHVEMFEQEFAEYCHATQAIGLSNGTDALILALLAMGIGPGDEVITVPNTFIATTEAISRAGAKPVFVDVLPDTYCMNPSMIEARITDQTKAIVPVHLYGQISEMETITAIARKHGLKILEDACQAHGAIRGEKRAGTFGDAAAFSMYPGKNLGAFGEAGCVVTSDERIADTIRCLKDHGQKTKYYHRLEGFNNRMDNLQAAALRAKLPFLDGWNAKRRELARRYLEKLAAISQIKLPVVKDFSAHVFHLFVILVPDPVDLSDYLKEKGVFTAFHYPVPLHLQEAYDDRGEAQGSYPVAEYCAKHLLSLPMFPELSESQVDRVCREIDRYYNRAA